MATIIPNTKGAAGMQERIYWTVHRCTNTPVQREVYLINGTPTFSCSCGDTVFTSEAALEQVAGAGAARLTPLHKSPVSHPPGRRGFVVPRNPPFPAADL
jgi:hypothetical protein